MADHQMLSPQEAESTLSTQPIDILVIGGGPAGISAALNAHSRGRSVAIISSDYKESRLYKAASIDNYPGLPHVSGAGLLDAMYEQTLALDIPVIIGTALSIMPPYQEGGSFQVSVGSSIFESKAIILTTGVTSKTIPGEDELLGNGVSYCATCDGMFFRGRSVAVMAFTREAIAEAAALQRIGVTVDLIINERDWQKWGQRVAQEEGIVNVRIETITSLTKEDAHIVLTAKDNTYNYDGVFILRDSISPQSLIKGVQMNGSFFLTDESGMTSISGLFAAGDACGKPLQIAKAVGEGQLAALSADYWMNQNQK